MSSIELWPKQQSAFEFVRSKPNAALLSEQRTGKTYISLKLLEAESKEIGNDYCAVLVVLLNNKVSTWKDKLKELVPELGVYEDFEEFKKARGKGPRVLLVHYEALTGIIKRLCKYRWIHRVIIDEAHRLYNRGSKQSKAAARLSWVPRKLILTGTPLEKKPTDMWAQFRFLAPEVLGTKHAEFEEYWLDWRKIDLEGSGARPGGPAWQQLMMKQRILKKKAKFKEELMEEFIDLLEPYCYRVDKQDVGILAPEIHVDGLEMAPSHRAMYQRLKKTGLVDLPDGTRIRADMPATLLMKLRQLASGFIYDEDQNVHWVSQRKAHRLIRLFEQSRKPVVIFCSFVPEVHLVHRLLRRQGYRVDKLWGGTPKRDRPAVLARFQAARLDALVCQTRAGGVGIDLWKSNKALVSSMDYSSIIWDQAKSRLDSKEKSVPASFTVINTKNTVDEELFDLVELKGQTTRQVLNLLKRRHTMATKDKTATKAKPTPPVRELPKYNVSHLATDLGVEPATVRILLRKSSLTKAGGAWGWETKAEYDSALKTLKALRTETAAAADAKPAKAQKAAPAKAPKAGKGKKAAA